MYNPSFNELSKLGDSRYTLVMLSAKEQGNSRWCRTSY